MKLLQIKIKNFRCYRSETLINLNDLTAFIGKNDSGKSTILEALEIFFAFVGLTAISLIAGCLCWCFPAWYKRHQHKDSREHQQTNVTNPYTDSETPNCQRRFHKTLQMNTGNPPATCIALP